MSESTLQSQIIRWLKDQGVYVIKPKAGPGVPVGCPDIIGLYRDLWIAIEVKASSNSPFQPGQKMTLEVLRQWSPCVYVAFPQNWEKIKTELLTLLRLS